MADLKLYEDALSPIRLRGHTLLCLQGFRGEGYSSEFVANMTVVYRALTKDPETWVEVIASPDAVCAACPHQLSSGCTLNGERSEEEIKSQDFVVLNKLGLEVGNRVRWRDILNRISRSVRGEDLPATCGTCRWLPLGYCREAMDRLRQQHSRMCRWRLAPDRSGPT
jgi:hypothetical protein